MLQAKQEAVEEQARTVNDIKREAERKDIEMSQMQSLTKTLKS